MPILIVHSTPEQKQVEFKDYASIGRSSRCTVYIKDMKLSRVHCEIIFYEDNYILVDLHSQNGTQVNGKPIMEAIIKPGDVLEIGQSKITFQQDTTGIKVLPEYKPLPMRKVGINDVEENPS